MNQQESDQIWQHLRFHIENFFSQPIANDVQRIEYKPQFITQLLEIPSKLHQKELQESTR